MTVILIIFFSYLNFGCCFGAFVDGDEGGGYKIKSTTPAEIKKEVLEQCPQIVSSDLEMEVLMQDQKRIPMTLSSSFLRFSEINDINKAFTVYAEFAIYWVLLFPNCYFQWPSIFSNTSKAFSVETSPLFRIKRDQSWLPAIIHFNAIEHSRPFTK